MFRLLVFIFTLLSSTSVTDAYLNFPVDILRSRSFIAFYFHRLLTSPLSRRCVLKSPDDSIGSPQIVKDLDFKTNARHLATSIDDHGEKFKGRIELVEGIGSSDSTVHSSQGEYKKAKAKAEKRMLLMVVATLYGAQYSVQTLLQRELPSSIVSLIRFVFASFIFLPRSVQYLYRMHNNLRSNREYYEGSKRLALGPIWGGIEVGLLSTMGYISQSLCLQFSTPSKCSFSMGLNILFVPLLDFAFKSHESTILSRMYGNLIDISRTVPALLAFTGVIFLECGGMDPPQFKDLLLLVTPWAFSAAFWRGEYYARKYPSDTSAMVGTLLGTSAFFSVLWSWFDGTLLKWGDLWTKIQNDQILATGLMFICFFCTAWATYHEQSGMQTISAAETTLIYSLEPLTATAFSAIILKEQLTKSTGYGACCILSACVLDALGLQYFRDLAVRIWTRRCSFYG